MTAGAVNRRALWFASVAVAAAALQLSGCETLSPSADTTDTTDTTEFAELDPPAGARRYLIDAERSQLVVKVYRAGAMAELGHNHIVSSNDLQGEVYRAEQVDDTVFEIRLPVTTIEIDPPELRSAAGDDFPGELDAEAIEGTRDNVLGPRQLDAANWPLIVLRGRGARGVSPDYQLLTDIAVRGNVHRVAVPARVSELPDGVLSVEGAFSVLQTELGLEPFSVMMGALQVRDQLDIEFSLYAIPQ